MNTAPAPSRRNLNKDPERAPRGTRRALWVKARLEAEQLRINKQAANRRRARNKARNKARNQARSQASNQA